MKQTMTKILLLLLTLSLAVGMDAAKKVHTIGDSTMAPYDESATITRGWGMYFGDFLINGWTSQNYARGGRDARSGYNELWLQNAKSNVEAGDYVLIQFAHNDEMFNGVDHDELAAIQTLSDTRGTNPSTTYKELLKKICDEVKEKGATPILVSPVCRFWFDSNGKIKRSGRHDLGDSFDKIEDGQLKKGLSVSADDHTMDYAWQMEQLAKAENIQFIDLTTASKELFEEYGSAKCATELQSEKTENGVTKVDGTHFRYMGALLVARLCAQLMKNAGVLADNIDVPTELSVLPAEASMGESYVGMTLTKELTIRGFGLTPETGNVSVSATNGIELSLDKQNWKSNLEIDYNSGILVKPFYARVILAAVGAVDGTITVSDGTKNINIPVTATGLEVSTGAPVTISWPFATDNTAKVEGPLTAEQTLTGMTAAGYTDGVQSLDVASGTWPKAEDDDAGRYTAFSMTSTSDNTLKLDNIAMKVGAKGGALSCHIYYTTDNFQTRKTLKELTGMADGSANEVSAQPIISLKKGETLQLRIYPWSEEEATGRQLTISDLVISGVEEGAGLQNEAVTITYKFDEGKEGQSATYGPKTQANSWFKSSYVEVGSNLNYMLKSNVGSANLTAFQPTAKHNAAGDATDFIDFVILPKKGLLFTPTKVSLKTCRYGTNGGNMTFAWVDGEGVETDIGGIVGGKEVITQNTIVDFSKEITGINATSDANRLRINLYSLDATKQVGYSDIVIEGTFTGVPQNSVQYRLTTGVNIDEAGSVTVTPAGIMFDEGDKVTVTANKNFGYKFVEWQDAEGKQVSTKAEEQVTMDAAKTMTAIFQKVNVYKVTTKVTNDAERDLGSITLTPNEHNGQYEEGTKITATANESKILKFTRWEDNSTQATREITVNDNMTITAYYEVNDFIAVFDASKTAEYANRAGDAYPFSADEVWDNQRNAKSCIVKMSDGSLLKGEGGTPVVRNRESVVISGINGLYQNGYRTTDIAWQYQFSTKGFTTAKFVADMCAKNAATKKYKALISVDGGDFTELQSAWDVTANVVNPIEISLPATAIDKETVIIRITGEGTEIYNTSYPFDKKFDGMDYCDHSESGVGNVFVLGDAIVEADETAPVITATIPAKDATGVSATGKITITFDERIESANSNGAVTLGNKTLQPEWSSRSVSFSYSQLDYGTAYTFTMPAGYVQDKSGNKYAEAVVISFTTMQRPSVEKALYDKVVSTATELKAAIDEANSRADKSTRYRIFLKKGEYKLPTGANKHYVHQDNNKTTTYWEGDLPDPITYITAANISFIGEDRDATIITQDISNGDEMLFNGQWGKAHKYERIGESDVLQLTGANTYFQDVTIKSGINDALGRNLAVHEKSNHTIYKNVRLWGYQDTWTSNADHGVFYFEGGIVRGRTDYLCGKGDAYFKDVELQQIHGGYPIVPSMKHNIGWVFKDCVINGADGVEKYGEKVYSADEVSGSFTLGRPWGSGTPAAYLIDTWMNVQPKAIGWDEMSGTNYPYRFAEYNSVNGNGVAIDLSQRKTKFGGSEKDNNNPRLTAEEAAELSDMSKMFGEWQPTLLTEQAPVPTNLQADGAKLSWTGSEYALLYAIVKDGKEIIDFTIDNFYTVPEDGQYAVRAANEMGGLSELSAAIEVNTTGIEQIANSQEPIATSQIFTLDGKRLQQLQRGINIVRLSDGTTKKIIVR